MSLSLEKGNKSYPPSNIQVFLRDGNKTVGELNGYRVNVEVSGGVDGSECYEEIYELMERYPELIDRYGHPRIAEVYQSDIVKDYRGQGFGTQMYIEFIRRFWDEESSGKPFILIPNGCNLMMEGSNTEDSMRVWESLGRKFPSAGSDWNTCIAVLKKPASINMAQRVASKYMTRISPTRYQ